MADSGGAPCTRAGWGSAWARGSTSTPVVWRVGTARGAKWQRRGAPASLCSTNRLRRRRPWRTDTAGDGLHAQHADEREHDGAQPGRLQLLLVPQALVGNTLFPPLLGTCVWAAAAAMRREELVEMASRKGGREATGYYHSTTCSRRGGTGCWPGRWPGSSPCRWRWCAPWSGAARCGLRGLSAGEKVVSEAWHGGRSAQQGREKGLTGPI